MYATSRLLYNNREGLENYLSHKTSELFDLQDKIILYDLTNTYFEGPKAAKPPGHVRQQNTMAHLLLAVLAYQLVSTIRFRLKAKGIHHNWSHIVRIMNTQKAATVTMQDKNDRKIYIRKCSKPEIEAREIYDALGYKYQPWVRKSLPLRQTGVLPQKQS